MNLKQLVGLGAGFSFCLTSFAANGIQDTSAIQKGKPIIRVFTNFHTGFGAENHRRGFELDRSYLGYEYALTRSLKVKAVMDIGKSSDVTDYQRIAYIKNAMLTWTYGKLRLDGGLISTTQFGIQEKFWGNRYVMKSFQDQYGFGSSADLGISAAYQFADCFSADVIVANGEGYKKVQVNDGLLYGAGVTFSPIHGLTLRIYGSMNEAADKAGKDILNLATFIGYKYNSFSIGGEYNRMENAGYRDHNRMEGVSVYGMAKLSKTIGLFMRYDQLFSPEAVNKEKEEVMFMGGAEFGLGKYVKLAPNIRYIHPTDGSKRNYCMAFINCYFGF